MMNTDFSIARCLYRSPCGLLRLAADEEGRLTECRWVTEETRGGGELPSVLREAARELDEYFLGRRREFRVPLLPCGTPFQLAVWRALADVGYGETTSYGELARTIGRGSAARAVAGALHANPISIFLPCHRVIASNGSLTGYAGGLAAKRWLLDMESDAKSVDKALAAF